MGEAGVRAGSLAVGVRPVPKFGGGAQRASGGPGEAMAVQ